MGTVTYLSYYDAINEQKARALMEACAPVITETQPSQLYFLLVHDLRRSGARDFRRAGVSEGEIMRLCGWRTRSMFDRYNIIDNRTSLGRSPSASTANKRQTCRLPNSTRSG